jgi:hypothetical protein
MPRISEFYGIFIYMYFRDVSRHHAPHIHVRYGEYRASFSIKTGERLAGRLPNKQTKRVQDWIDARRSELEGNWQRALRGEALKSINPL